MVSAARSIAHGYRVPLFDSPEEQPLDPSAVLSGFVSHFFSCFPRSESRDNFRSCLLNRLFACPGLDFGGVGNTGREASVRGLQRFLSESLWRESEILDIHRRLAGADLGHPGGALILQEAGFAKRGRDSAGACRQQRPETGREQNCQVGVFCSYASALGCCLVDKRLYVPKHWYSRKFAARRRSCGIASEPGYCGKIGLAGQMLRQARECGSLPYSYVVSDLPCGNSPDLEEMQAEMSGASFLLAVPGNALCRVAEDMPGLAVLSAGEEPERESRAERVQDLAERVNPFYWYRYRLSEGESSREYDTTAVRVRPEEGGLAGQRLWLLVKRTVSSPVRYYFYLSNAAHGAGLSGLAWLSNLPAAGRQGLEEARRLTGLDQYETRKLRGWHRHMLLCMLAQYFRWHMKIAAGKNSSGFTGLVE